MTHRCPYCGREGISAFRKLWIGPATSAHCSECGGRVTVPWGRSLLALLPLLVAVGAWGALEATMSNACSLRIATFWLGAVGGGLLLFLWTTWVPLIRLDGVAKIEAT